MAERSTIGSLRHPVTLVRRAQAPHPGGTGIDETDGVALAVHARVEPVGAITYYGTTAVDTPLSHRIIVRHCDGLDTTWFVLRDRLNRDGTIKRERFRIHRILEDGIRVQMVLECELEAYA